MSDDSHSVPSTIKKNLHKLEHSETMESIQNISDDYPTPDAQSYERSHSPLRRRQYDLIHEENNEGDMIGADDTRVESPLYGEGSLKLVGAVPIGGLKKNMVEYPNQRQGIQLSQQEIFRWEHEYPPMFLYLLGNFHHFLLFLGKCALFPANTMLLKWP